MTMPTKQETKEAALGMVLMVIIGLVAWNWWKGDDAPEDAAAAPVVSVETPAVATVPSAEVEPEPSAEPAPVQPTAEEIAEKERVQRYGHHCLSVWSGSLPAFVRAVEKQLTDPDSFDHIETITWPVHDGRNTIMMRFRSKNGFGGFEILKASGSFDNQTCSDVQITSIK